MVITGIYTAPPRQSQMTERMIHEVRQKNNGRQTV
jgi:hypothetical protein